MKKRITFTSAGKLVFDVFLFLIFFLPFYWMVLTSIKTMGETLKMPPSFWVSNPQWENFVTAFNAIPFLNMLKNSLIVVFGTLFCPVSYTHLRAHET